MVIKLKKNGDFFHQGGPKIKNFELKAELTAVNKEIPLLWYLCKALQKEETCTKTRT